MKPALMGILSRLAPMEPEKEEKESQNSLKMAVSDMFSAIEKKDKEAFEAAFREAYACMDMEHESDESEMED